jgi:lysophospholipase L1-like esterase
MRSFFLNPTQGFRPTKEKCRTFVSGEISHLMRDKGYPQPRAVAAALSQARRAGCKVGPNPNRRDNPDRPKAFEGVSEADYDRAATAAGLIFLDASTHRAITVADAANLLSRPQTVHGVSMSGAWFAYTPTKRRKFAEVVLADLVRRCLMVITCEGFRNARALEGGAGGSRSVLRLETNPIGYKANPTEGEWLGIGIAVASVAIGIGSLVLQRQSLELQKKTTPGGGTTPTPTPKPSGIKLLSPGASWKLFGDSLVGAMPGQENAGGLTPLLAAKSATYGSPFSGEGQVGSTILDWAREIDAGTLTPDDAKAQIIALSLGTNDAAMTTPVDETQALEKVATFFRQGGATLVWILPPVLGTSKATPNGARVRQLLQSHADAGWFLLFDPGQVPMAPDGYHPTGPGYQAIADRLFLSLTQNLT